jgi:hypothetical protein
MFKLNRIIGFVFAILLLYGLLQTLGLLPAWAPVLPRPSGPPAA